MNYIKKTFLLPRSAAIPSPSRYLYRIYLYNQKIGCIPNGIQNVDF